MKIKTLTEKRFYEWHEDDVSVTLRNRSGSYGGGSEVLVVYTIDEKMGQTYVHEGLANTLAQRAYKQPQAVIYESDRDDSRPSDTEDK